MIRVIYSCLVEQHDLRLVGLAAAVCLFACATAVNLLANAQQATGKRRPTWLLAAATVFGSGVWATHFVAELAYRPGIPVGYEIKLTLVSIAIAVGVTGLGMLVVLRPGARYLGGAIIGAAVGAMHYTGMAALRAPADFHWHPGLIVASLAVGCALAALAMEVFGPKPELRHRIGAAALLLLAIVSLHFTGMAALTFTLDPTVAMPEKVIAPDLLALTVAAIVALIITLGLAGSFLDRQLAQRALEESDRLQRRIEERTAELREAQDELLRNARLSALGQLTATMAHELRNPLSAIANTIYTVKHEVTGSGLEFDRSFARIDRSLKRCERIINDLLDFTRMKALRLSPVTIDRWLGEVLDDQKFDPQIHIIRQFGAPDCTGRFDSERMRRVIINLVENATHALAESTADGERQIIVATQARAEEFALTIADNGPGIAPDILPKIFEPLFSTKTIGTGLGLPIVKQIVELHGGSIAIDSALGQGTRVAIRLPRTPANAAPLLGIAAE